jgi:hypothetical protein
LFDVLVSTTGAVKRSSEIRWWLRREATFMLPDTSGSVGRTGLDQSCAEETRPLRGLSL